MLAPEPVENNEGAPQVLSFTREGRWIWPVGASRPIYVFSRKDLLHDHQYLGRILVSPSRDGSRLRAKTIYIIRERPNLSTPDLHSWRETLKDALRSEFVWVNTMRLSLLAGDQSALSPEIWETFNQLGLSHWLVVSGGHLAILTLVFLWLLARSPIPVRWRRRRYVIAIVLLFFGWFLQAEISILRALVCLVGFASLSIYYPRLSSYSPLEQLGLCGVLFGLISPALILSPGFVLSFGGAAALMGFKGRFRMLQVSLVMYSLCMGLGLGPHPASPILNLLFVPLLFFCVGLPTLFSFIGPLEALSEAVLRLTMESLTSFSLLLPVANESDALWQWHLGFILVGVGRERVGLWALGVASLWPWVRLL